MAEILLPIPLRVAKDMVAPVTYYIYGYAQSIVVQTLFLSKRLRLIIIYDIAFGKNAFSLAAKVHK